jgi:hypothetical protein
LNTVYFNQSGISSEVIAKSALPLSTSSLTSPKVVNLTYAEGNNSLNDSKFNNSDNNNNSNSINNNNSNILIILGIIIL